jgi:hypothetical protein
MVQEFAGSVGGVAVHGGPGVVPVGVGLLGSATFELGLASSSAGLGPPGPGRWCCPLAVVTCWPPALAATTTVASRGGRAVRSRVVGGGGARNRGVVAGLIGDNVVDEVIDGSVATLASPALPGVTLVSVMISLSGSIATWPL